MAWPITAADIRDELGAGWGTTPPVPPAVDPLEPWATAATERIEAEIGQARGQNLTTVVHGPASVAILTGRAATLVSVTADGIELDPDTFILDGPAGLVTGRFPAGRTVVVATAPTTVPMVVELATRLLAATWVKQSRVGPPSPTTRAAAPDTDVAQGFAMPRRVSEMIRPFTTAWGFA